MTTSKFRSVTPRQARAGEDEFVRQAKTALSFGSEVQPTQPQPTLVNPTEADDVLALNPRVMRQLNIDVPETLHYELRSLVDTMPRMSMRKFVLEAIAEKMTRTRAGQGA